MAEVQLLTIKYSPYGQRVHIALAEKKIPFNVTIMDLANKPQVLLDANPIYKKIPTIIDNGKPVAESLVILEYLEDAYPEHVPLMPKDAFGRSKVRFWVDYIYKGFSMITNSFRAKPGSPEKHEAQEGIIPFFKTLESTMASNSPDGPFFMGDNFGYVDVVMAPLCNSLGLLENIAKVRVPGPDAMPRFYKWTEAMRAHPSVNAVLPTAEDNLSFVKARFAKLAAAAPKCA